MHRRTVKQLEAAGATVTPVSQLDRKQLLLALAARFDGISATYQPYYQLENKSKRRVRALTLDGTMFVEVALFLRERGYETDGTLGSIMRSPLDFTKNDIHWLACSCYGSQMDAGAAATRVRLVAERDRYLLRFGRWIKSWVVTPTPVPALAPVPATV